MLARRPRLLFLALLALSAAPLAKEPTRVAQFGDAFVDFDYGAGEWTIGNSQIRYTVETLPDRTLSVRGLSLGGATSDPVTLSREPDSLITIDNETTPLGARVSDFRVDMVLPTEGSHFVSLAVRMISIDRTLGATRHYVVYPGVAIVEMWTEIATLDGARRTIGNLNAMSLSVPAGDLDYILGLDGPAEQGGAFTRRSQQLAPGAAMTLASATLSTEATVPYFSIANGHRRVFGGLLWSGAWSATFERAGDAVRTTWGLPAMSAWARPGRPIEAPHAFVGAVFDAPGADVAELHKFVFAGRAGRPFHAFTTFNTWFVRGINVDEETIQRDIDRASDIGLEMLQLDAGWYPREGAEHAFDFTAGLGSWEVDGERFPGGLFALGEYARSRGVKFGVWVEPERVAMETVGRRGGADVSYLATQHGEYAPGTPNEAARDAQICLADPAARAWVQQRLTQLLDDVRPDNLKWDFNRWIHCTRADHDHPVDGGNYEHTRGLYELLALLRQRYPSLLIENCAQGGHRLDLAMTRLTDAAWMDDRTSPSAHVRRNLQGLLSIFPGRYLFSYFMGHPDEPVRGGLDLPLLARSRMPGVFGVALELGELSEGETNQLAQQIYLAKALRDMQGDAISYPITPQRPGPGEWEVVQQFSPSTGLSIIYAFSNGAASPFIAPLRGIELGTTYELRSADRGTLGYLQGAQLIARGLEIFEAPESGGQVLVLQPIISSAWKPGFSLAPSSFGFSRP